MTSTTINTGTCPVCVGTTRRPVPVDYERRFLKWSWGWDEETDTFPCNNCGGQTMSGKGSGTVPLRQDGIPCTHEYNTRQLGRCCCEFTCKHCGYVFCIDSGD